MKLALWIGLLAGLALFAGLLISQDAGKVLAVLALAGWGLLLIAFVHLAVVVANAMSWRALLGRAGRRPLLRLAWMWWIGTSINTLLPVAQMGGELVRARLLARSGVPGALAGATVVVGLTASVLALLIFAAAGAAFLAAAPVEGGGGQAAGLLAGLVAFGCLLLGFYLAQRGGLFLRLARALERLAGGREWLALTGGAAALDRAILALYRDWRAFLACCLWRFAAYLAGIAEVWLALYSLGHPVSLAVAFTLESLGQAVRGAGFAVPGALGVQEGGFLALGALLGLPGEVALALSLVKRVRELLLGLPGLAAWQVEEGWEFIKKRRVGPR